MLNLFFVFIFWEQQMFSFSKKFSSKTQNSPFLKKKKIKENWKIHKWKYFWKILFQRISRGYSYDVKRSWRKEKQEKFTKIFRKKIHFLWNLKKKEKYLRDIKLKKKKNYWKNWNKEKVRRKVLEFQTKCKIFKIN